MCRLCGVLDDDLHYVLVCRRYTALRDKHIPAYYRTDPDCAKLQELLNSRTISDLHRLALYLLESAPLQLAQYEIDRNIDNFARHLFSMG